MNSSPIDILGIFQTIGIVAIFGAFIYIGRKLQILDDLKNTSEKIKANLKVVSDFLTRSATEFNPSELQAMSPLELTQVGKDFLEKVEFIPVFEAHKDDFFRCIYADSPKLKYDVETSAIKSLYSLSSETYMDFLKSYFYTHPTRNMGNTAPTLGVYIRDKYLEVHPEILE